MPNFEQLKMLELVRVLRTDVLAVEEQRSAAAFRQARKDLQDIYNCHLISKKSFTGVEYYLKNLYTSFNYGAVIVNEALKKRNLDGENGVKLEECLETMISCCDKVTEGLTQPPQPPRTKKK